MYTKGTSATSALTADSSSSGIKSSNCRQHIRFPCSSIMVVSFLEE